MNPGTRLAAWPAKSGGTGETSWAGGTFAPGGRQAAAGILGDVSWLERAACRGMDGPLFFGPDGEARPDLEIREAKAKAVCQRCPVRGLCLDFALRNSIRYGIWGGLNAEERTRERRRRARRPYAA